MPSSLQRAATSWAANMAAYGEDSSRSALTFMPPVIRQRVSRPLESPNVSLKTQCIRSRWDPRSGPSVVVVQDGTNLRSVTLRQVSKWSVGTGLSRYSLDEGVVEGRKDASNCGGSVSIRDCRRFSESHTAKDELALTDPGKTLALGAAVEAMRGPHTEVRGRCSPARGGRPSWGAS